MPVKKGRTIKCDPFHSIISDGQILENFERHSNHGFRKSSSL